MMPKLKIRSLLFLILQAFPLSLFYGQPKTLTILHTNDMHAGFLPHSAAWVQDTPKPTIGGFKELAWTIDSLRGVHRVNILLDAGDVMTGSPISEYDYQGVAGGALFTMMNVIGYDAWTVGNHDLDISQDNLRGLMSIAKFPTVCANLTDSSGQFLPGTTPFIILHRGGLTIGIIGIMSRELFQLTNTNNLKNLRVESPVETAQRYADSLQSKTDLIIALTHEGIEEDSVLAMSTHGINVIIGGHSHTRLKNPKAINGVLICQTGANCENLGELNLTIEDHKITSSTGKLLPLWTRHPSVDSPVAQLVDQIKDTLDRNFTEVIGTLSVDWKRNGKGESNIGNFIADAIRDAGKAQVGITNSSGIRKDLNAGPIRKSDIFEVMPFRNIVCTFTLTGKELHDFAERFVHSLAEGKSSLQLSGLHCTWKRDGDSLTIVSVTVGGKDIVDSQHYLCATSDFVVNQGEKYLGFKPQEVLFSNATVYQAILEKVRQEKIIQSQVEGRFKEQH